MVKIDLNPTSTTVRDVVVEDYRTAAIFQQYGLDFCCGGGATIEQACAKKGVDAGRLLGDLSAVMAASGSDQPHIGAWDVGFLADYIVQNHHRYVRSVLPTILAHAAKVARVHGAARPELIEIARLFAAVAGDLEAHLAKEEDILFPYIKLLAAGESLEKTPPFGTVENPIRMMEAEHDDAGEQMKEIRRLSNNYTPPADACMTYRVLFSELEEFERDLYRHVHLENNILFPKVRALVPQKRKKNPEFF